MNRNEPRVNFHHKLVYPVSALSEHWQKHTSHSFLLLIVKGILSSTGSPQSCVLVASLYVLFPTDFHSHHVNTAGAPLRMTLSLSADDEFSHGPGVDDFRCNDFFRQLKVTEMRKICIYFKSTHPLTQSSLINYQKADIVNNLIWVLYLTAC